MPIKIEISSQIPSLSKDVFRKSFDQAGIMVDKGDSHYTIVNFLRGGIVSHFVNGSQTIENTGLAFTNKIFKIAYQFNTFQTKVIFGKRLINYNIRLSLNKKLYYIFLY